jgi:type IX secretion system PorP/SprF family membrane protein
MNYADYDELKICEICKSALICDTRQPFFVPSSSYWLHNKTKHMKKLYTSFFLLLLGIAVKAQDPEFTQFYANPLYLNPAMAGSNLCPRIAMNYRVQWPNVYGTYSTYGVSFDKYAYKLKGGIGFMAMTDRAAQGTLNTTGVGVIYAPTVQLGRTKSIRAAIQVGYWQKTLDWTKLYERSAGSIQSRKF